MNRTVPEILQRGRIRLGHWGSDDDYGLTGAFEIAGPMGQTLRIIASEGDLPDAQGWEHVSVSLRNRCPNWPEMCFVKELFWGADETVVQFHPPKSQYVNCHPYCLHLWRNASLLIPTPPMWMVGPSPKVPA